MKSSVSRGDVVRWKDVVFDEEPEALSLRRAMEARAAANAA